MNHRIRMARKRLMVAREREWTALYWVYHAKTYGAVPCEIDWAKANYYRKSDALRAIERRKEKIA